MVQVDCFHRLPAAGSAAERVCRAPSVGVGMRVATELADVHLPRHRQVQPAGRPFGMEGLADRRAGTAESRALPRRIGRQRLGVEGELLRLPPHEQIERELFAIDRHGLLRRAVEQIDRHRVGGFVVDELRVVVLFAELDKRPNLRPLSRYCSMVSSL